MKTSIPVAAVIAGTLAAIAGQVSVNGAKPNPIATMITLPSLGGYAQAQGINAAGTVVVGQSFDRPGFLYAVKWTLQGGSWVISTLPLPGTAATARSVDRFGNIAGHDASRPEFPVLWPAAGGYSVLGCDGAEGRAYALSDDAQVVVGNLGSVGSPARPVAWAAPGYCAELLPVLDSDESAVARAVSETGTVIGGVAVPAPEQPGVPVRWVKLAAGWQLQVLDTQQGIVNGANALGDLVGSITTAACGPTESCSRGVIWYAAGGTRELGTLGGAFSSIYDINNEGEAVGVAATRSNGMPFFWSQTRGMLQLPVTRGGIAFAVSDVRADGTRVVAGAGPRGKAVIWIVRNP
jgi:uncharacterized membrane protein